MPLTNPISWNFSCLNVFQIDFRETETEIKCANPMIAFEVFIHIHTSGVLCWE